MERETGKGPFISPGDLAVINMSVSSGIINETDLEHIIGQTVIDMKVNGKRPKEQDRVPIFMLTGPCYRGNGKIIHTWEMVMKIHRNRRLKLRIKGVLFI